MNSLAHILGTPDAHHPLRDQFFKWQCRVRQIAMRENAGQPDDAVMPEITINGADVPIGRIITVLPKAEAFSKTPELRHIFKSTNDPAQRRTKALELFSETYFQKAREFSGVLTATFNPESRAVGDLRAAPDCVLSFEGYGHRFELFCAVMVLEPRNALYQATWWHNALFNPNLSVDTEILAFAPDWERSVAEKP